MSRVLVGVFDFKMNAQDQGNENRFAEDYGLKVLKTRFTLYRFFGPQTLHTCYIWSLGDAYKAKTACFQYNHR